MKVGGGIGGIGHIHCHQNLLAILLQIYIAIDPVLASEPLAGKKLLGKFCGFDIALKEAVF